MWWQQYLLDHVGVDKKQFVAVATGDFRHSMCIPWEVGNHLGSMISGTIKLDAPNGIFHIGVCRETGELVLQSGWDDFVAKHHVEENYYFWFVYRGNSTFKVRIFDSNCHEKATSRSQPPSQSFGGVPPAATCTMLNEQVLSDPPPHTDNYASSSDDDHTMEEGCYDDHTVEPHSSSNLEGPSQHPYILSEGRTTTLNSVEKKKVEEKVQAIQSEFPIFVAVMTKSRINSRQLDIPKEYARQIPFISMKTDLVLQAEGGTEQRTRFVRREKMRYIQSGWKTFVAENKVQEGDIALFEQAESRKKLRMTVHFIRKSGAPI